MWVKGGGEKPGPILFHQFTISCQKEARKQVRGGHEEEKKRRFDVRSTASYTGTLTRPLVQRHAQCSWQHPCKAQRICKKGLGEEGGGGERASAKP